VEGHAQNTIDVDVVEKKPRFIRALWRCFEGEFGHD